MHNELLPTLTRWTAALIGLVWCYIEPTVPFVLICALAVLVDCVTAWRLNRRIRRHYSKEVADGKLKSSHMSRMVSDLAVVFLCIILADQVDKILLPHWGGIHLGNYVAAIFCLTQLVSILENESSCNGASWAILAQKILADKTERHLEINIEEFRRMKRKYNRQHQKAKQQNVSSPVFGDSSSEPGHTPLNKDDN